MADPQKYTRDYSFTDYQASNPSAPLPGLQVDAELEDVEASIGEIVDAIKDVRRSDGALKNGIVTVDSLDATVAAGVGSGALASAVAAAASADAASDSAVAAAASATAASGSATSASGYASNALTSRNEASGFSDDAAAMAVAAAGYRDFAAAWATAAEGVDVNDGVNPVGKSSYHWAQVALGAVTGALPDGSVTPEKLAPEVTNDIESRMAASVYDPQNKQTDVFAAIQAQSDFFRGLAYAPNASSPTIAVDVLPGACRDSTNEHTIILPSTITKNITAPFNPGSHMGGYDGGVPFVEEAYWLHLIWNPTTETADVLCSFSPSAPVMPAGFTKRRLIGGFHYSSGVSPFLNVGEWQFYTGQMISALHRPNTPTVGLQRLTLPIGLKLEARVFFQADSTTGGDGYVMLRDPDLGDLSGWRYLTGQQLATQAFVTTDNLGRIKVSDTNANGRLTIIMEGWRLDRSAYR